MKLLFANGLLTNEIISALCWTLLHSLWQGLLLALIAALVIQFTKKMSASLRYNLFTGLFLLFILSACVTFSWQFEMASGKKSVDPGAGINLGYQSLVKAVALEEGYSGETPVSFADRIMEYFNTHAPIIVAIWFIVFSAKLVKILAGLGYIQRIRHSRNHPVASKWKIKIKELAGKLQMRKEVLLLQSELIRVPVVIGFFKPVVLVPLGLLTHLPPDQVEAVLLHELAHIRRKDYLVNLLQSLAETFFFFNPALLWISSLIREERENCCDDIALAEVKNKNQFIHALVAFQEYHQNPLSANASIAFAGQSPLAQPGETDHL